MSGSGGTGGGGGIAQIGLAGLGFLESYNQAEALKRQADFEAQQQRFNAELLKIQEKEIKRQADRETVNREARVRQAVGSQKVALAAQGVEVDSDLGAVLEAEERRVGLEDVAAIRNNAWRDAMGLEIKRMDTLFQARSTELRGRDARRSTLVTGGLRAASGGISGFRNYRRGVADDA